MSAFEQNFCVNLCFVLHILKITVTRSVLTKRSKTETWNVEHIVANCGLTD